MIVMTRKIGIQSSASQALPPPLALTLNAPEPVETSTLNQSKNMKMKSRIAEIPEIFSPSLSLSRSIRLFP